MSLESIFVISELSFFCLENVYLRPYLNTTFAQTDYEKKNPEDLQLDNI